MTPIQLKKPKIQKFLALTAGASILPNALLFSVGTLVPLACAYFFMDAIPHGPVFGSVVSGSLILGAFLPAGINIFNANNSKKINRFFSANDFYQHNLYQILKSTSEEVGTLTGVDKKRYLAKRKAQLIILNKDRGGRMFFEQSGFNKKHAALFALWEDSVQEGMSTTPGFKSQQFNRNADILYYLQTKLLQETKIYSFMDEAVAEELAQQKITVEDLVFDLYQLIKLESYSAYHQNDVRDYIQPSIDTISYLTTVYFKQNNFKNSLSEKESEKTLALLNKIKDPDVVKNYVDILISSLKYKDQFSVEKLSQFITKSNLYPHYAVKDIQYRLQALPTREVQLESGSTQKAVVENKLDNSTITQKEVDIQQLFKPNIIALLASAQIEKMVGPLQVGLETKNQIQTVFTDIKERLDKFEAQAHLLTTDKSHELKVLVNQNVPLLTQYVEQIGLLDSKQQEQYLNKILEVAHSFQTNIDSFQFSVGQDLGKNIQALRIYMQEKENTLTTPPAQHLSAHK